MTSAFINSIPNLISDKIKTGFTLAMMTFIDEVNQKQPFHGTMLVVGTFSSMEKAETKAAEIRKQLSEIDSGCCAKIHLFVFKSGGWGLLKPGENRIDGDRREYDRLLAQRTEAEKARREALDKQIEQDNREADDINTLSGVIYNWYCLTQHYLRLKSLAQEVNETLLVFDERLSNLAQSKLKGMEWTFEIKRRLSPRGEEAVAEQVIEMAREMTEGTLQTSDIPNAGEVWLKVLKD